MNTEKLNDQLELYSNAIVGFTVAQSLAFSFTFGTSTDFGCEITRYRLLAIALAAHFILATVLAGWAIFYLKDRISSLSPENREVVGAVFKAKAVVCVLFALIPVGLLISFGVLGDPTKGRCAKLLKAPPPAITRSGA